MPPFSLITVVNILATVPNFAASSRDSTQALESSLSRFSFSDGAARYINASLSQFVDSKTTFNDH